MDILEAFESAKAKIGISSSGCRPGISEAEIRAIETTLKARLPDDFRRLLASCGEIEDEKAVAEVDFTGRTMAVEFSDFPSAHFFAHNGAGNFWFVDCLPRVEEQAHIFFLGHDPVELTFQCVGMEDFLTEWAKRAVNEELPFSDAEVSALRPPLSQAEAAQSSDEAVRTFARNLSVDHVIVDLRRAKTGDGIDLEQFGPETKIIRYYDQRLFAYKPYIRPKKRGFLRALFGGS